jgi:PAS domain S-box-containing protein
MSKTRILIVEDEPVIGMDLQNILMSLRYDVPAVIASGEEAIEKAEELKPDLILMDIILSGDMDGIDATKRIREKLKIPVIYLTAHTEEFTFKRARETDPYGYLVKPVGKGDLYTAVETAIRRHELETRLQESENRYRELVMNSNEAILVAQDGFIRFANPKLTEISGYSYEELTSMPFSEFIHPDDQNMVFERHLKRLRGEHPDQVYTFRIIDKKGTIKWLEINATLFEWEEKPATLNFLSDITARRHAEEALRESEERFRMLAEQNLMGITLLQDDMIKYANQAASDINEYSVEEIMNWKPKEFHKSIHPDDLPFIIEQGRKKQMGDSRGIVTHYPYRIITKSGKVKWVEQYSRTVYYQGRPADLITRIDITDRIHFERALRESEKKYRELVENINEVVYSIDENGIINYISPVVETFYGYKPSELAGRKFIDFIHEDDRERITAGFRRSLQDMHQAAEYRLLTETGKTRWFRISEKTLYKGDRPKGVQGLLTDITEYKRAEEALRESEKKYRLLADNVTDVIWTLDIKTMRFTYVSPSNIRMTGFTPDEAMLRTVEDSLTPSSLETAMKILKEELSNDKNADPNRSRILEMEQHHKDGHTVWTEIRVRFLRDSEGKPVEILGISRDITERRRTEKQIKASLREKEILLKEVHHRVKNNFQIISSLLNLHERKIINGELVEHFKDFSHRIRAMALVHERLYQSEDLARIDFAEYINIIANKLYQEFQCDPERLTIKIKAQDVQLGIDRAIPCGLILNELISNAMKHAFPPGSNKKGVISIDLHQREDKTIKLKIGDNGVGMPKNFNIDSTDSLGLRLMKNLIQNQLRGEYDINRQRGTRYTITFPGE